MNQSAPTASRPPKSRGRIMDFAPRKPIISPNPPAPQPVIKMPATPARAPQTVVYRQAPTQAPAPSPRPPVHRPPVHHTTVPAQPAPKRPLSQPAPAPAIQLTPVPSPEAEAQQPPKKPAAKPTKKPAPLGARSPFFKKSVSVEKRPLSGGAASVTHSRTNQSVRDLPRPQIQHSSAIKLSNRKSKLPLVLLIVGTILVGAAVGACAYFLVFQGE